MPYNPKYQTNELIDSFRYYIEINYEQRDDLIKCVKNFFEIVPNAQISMNLFLDYWSVMYQTKRIYKRTVYKYAVDGIQNHIWKQFTEVNGYKEYHKQKFFQTMNQIGFRHAIGKTIASIWGCVKDY